MSGIQKRKIKPLPNEIVEKLEVALSLPCVEEQIQQAVAIIKAHCKQRAKPVEPPTADACCMEFLDEQIANCLESAGIFKMVDLGDKTDAELLKIRRIGPLAIAAINAAWEKFEAGVDLP